MLNQLTNGAEDSPEEILVSKYFKRDAETEQRQVDLKVLRQNSIALQSENWHVKRDDEKYSRKPLQEKAAQALASLEGTTTNRLAREEPKSEDFYKEMD